MESGVIKHETDFGGLLGFSCADLQVGPIGFGWSSHPGCKCVGLDLHQATHDGFCMMEDSACSGGACGGGGAGASGGQFALLNNLPGWSYLLGTGACWYGD